MKIISLASGSAGNAYLVGAEGSWLMIDCGLGPRTLKERLSAVGLADVVPEAILLTHNHTDHISGLATFHRHYPDVPFFANWMTAEATSQKMALDADVFSCFENGQDFEVGPFAIHPFSIPHDTCDPVGYLISTEGLTYFHGTDIGTPLDSVGYFLARAQVATLEANHDLALLRASTRAASLKSRIAGPRGHLSNDQTAEFLRRFTPPHLKTLALAHLSRECNAPHLAEAAVRAALSDLKRSDIELSILSQDVPQEIFG